MNAPRVNPTFICELCQKVTPSEDESPVMDFCNKCDEYLTTGITEIALLSKAGES